MKFYFYSLKQCDSLQLTRTILSLRVVWLATWHIVILKYTVKSIGGMPPLPPTYWNFTFILPHTHTQTRNENEKILLQSKWSTSCNNLHLCCCQLQQCIYRACFTFFKCITSSTSWNELLTCVYWTNNCWDWDWNDVPSWENIDNWEFDSINNVLSNIAMSLIWNYFCNSCIDVVYNTIV